MTPVDILIVDDDPNVSKAIQRALKPSGYQIQSAGSGPEALELLSGFDAKVIISDVKMRLMDGFELLNKVHARCPATSRMVLSGHTDVALILKLVNQNGIDRYLTKPWEPEDLLLAVETCVDLYDLRCTSGTPPV